MIYANNDPRVCQFLPPLVMEIEMVDWIMERLDKALTAAHRLKPLANVKYQVQKIVKKLI
jgi:acetylornithine/succinyldiaminopimelate/putrescine aminotransferase